jgi:hypothetical protein
MGQEADHAWQKAAACEAHAQAATDSKLRAMFLKLRQSWTDRKRRAVSR